MRYQPKYAIGLLKDANGMMTTTPEETLEVLASTSFPGNRAAKTEEEHIRDLITRSNKKGSSNPETADWRNIDRIKKAVASFSPMKAAGPDEVKPIVLQNLPDAYLGKLSTIYDAVMTSGYNPREWRKAKVVYISKPGKDTYGTAKSFRPISLTPFIFKTLERLVYWHMQETTLQENPFNDNQHAFRTSRGTETALHQAICEIEKGYSKETMPSQYFSTFQQHSIS